eukprot:Selendium_serpulae@DN993_c0_g1_i1.p1
MRFKHMTEGQEKDLKKFVFAPDTPAAPLMAGYMGFAYERKDQDKVHTYNEKVQFFDDALDSFRNDRDTVTPDQEKVTPKDAAQAPPFQPKYGFKVDTVNTIDPAVEYAIMIAREESFKKLPQNMQAEIIDNQQAERALD